jgi:hypothetical protein
MIASNRGKRLPIQALRVFDGRLVSATAMFQQFIDIPLPPVENAAVI